jgi:hypothetical protein
MPFMEPFDPFNFDLGTKIDVSNVNPAQLNDNQLAGKSCCKCSGSNGFLFRVFVQGMALYACYPECHGES